MVLDLSQSVKNSNFLKTETGREIISIFQRNETMKKFEKPKNLYRATITQQIQNRVFFSTICTKNKFL